MANIVSSTQMTLVILSLFFILPTPNHASYNSSPLVAEICSKNRFNLDPKLCTQVLENQTLIAAGPKNYFDLSIAIITSGIWRASDTKTHVSFLLKNRPNMSSLITCNSSYYSVFNSLFRAREDVMMNDYEGARKDLVAASIDNIKGCQDSLFSGRIKDQIIVSGNRVVPILGLAAFEAVDRLSNNASKNM